MIQRRSLGIHAALHWRNGRQLPRATPNAALRDWLLDTGSLTRRVQCVCPGRFRVRVESQGWGRPRLDECRALGVRVGRVALIREVHLLCDDRPWVFARTVIPLSTLRGARRRLAHLGDRPLGAVLFADPHMQRGPVEVTRIAHGSALFMAATQGVKRRPQAIWGRRSVFRLSGKPLLVSEFFLPALFAAGRLNGARDAMARGTLAT